MFTHSNKTTKEPMEERKIDLPKIFITYEALLKMNQIVNTCTAEVGWLGSVKTGKDGYYITDVYLMKQSVSGVTTELDEDDLHDFFQNLIINDPDKYNTIKLWGHSHVKMPVNPSSQDDETFKEYYQDNPFFIRLIANQKEDMRIDIAIKEDGYIYYNVPWEIVYPKSIIEAMEMYAEASEILKEAEENIKKARANVENSFKDEINKEIKAKVVEERKVSKNTKALPYAWGDNEYESYYDYYYGYDQEYEEDYMDYIMQKCDSGTKIKVTEGNTTKYANVTDVFEPMEIIEVATLCSNWKGVRDYFADDERVKTYSKKNYIDLFNEIIKINKEYERRTA